MAKNIILLSDGTGNSSISISKSNVWRLYDALDLGPAPEGAREQIAIYDDGVGTSGFKPLKVVGGAFGWGLSRNVRELYETLCRHYQPGDKIYIFGFSRGAFTARVLAHFISSCGILDPAKLAPNKDSLRMNTDRGLKIGASQAYKSYRQGYWNKASWFPRTVAKLFRPIRDLAFGKVPSRKDFFADCSRPKPDDGSKLIEFVGVWDTVDAVGVPIDELTDVIDKWIYPYKFPDHKFSADIAKGCHALAIDDERQTFHPLLWDERASADEAVADPSCINQVWFAGMHSNVGGSYPEDNLAYVALDWMIGQTQTAEEGEGLRFSLDSLAAIKQKADPAGKMYDSRRGAGIYYRYKPRSIAELCGHDDRPGYDPQANSVRLYVDVPKIHHSVIDRIAGTKVGYAPTALPKDFDIVASSGEIIDIAECPKYQAVTDTAAVRASYMARAEQHLFWRRTSYFSLLIATLAIIAVPFIFPAIPGWIPPTEWELFTVLPKSLSIMFHLASAFIPNVVAFWTNAWTQSANLFAALAVIFAGLIYWSSWINTNVQTLSETGWWQVKGHQTVAQSKAPRVFERFASWYRSSKFGDILRGAFKRWVLPYGIMALSIYLLAGLSYRLFVHYPFVKDGICARSYEAEAKKSGTDKATIEVARTMNKYRTDWPPVKFKASNPCMRTGIKLKAGKVYAVSTTVSSNWKGGAIEPTFNGLPSLFERLKPAFIFGIPGRRRVSMPWFTLIGEIGRDGGGVFPINNSTFKFRAKKTGELHLYLNDYINVLGKSFEQPDGIPTSTWDAGYQNNLGAATITITPVEEKTN